MAGCPAEGNQGRLRKAVLRTQTGRMCRKAYLVSAGNARETGIGRWWKPEFSVAAAVLLAGRHQQRHRHVLRGGGFRGCFGLGARPREGGQFLGIDSGNQPIPGARECVAGA